MGHQKMYIKCNTVWTVLLLTVKTAKFIHVQHVFFIVIQHAIQNIAENQQKKM